MGNRILTWHHEGTIGNETRIGPTYYMERNYTPVAVRIYAATAPTSDAEVDIYDDGTSIFNNRTPLAINRTTGVNETGASATAAVLGAGVNAEENAEDFVDSPIIEEGSWVHCNLKKAGGGKNFTVHLELFSPDEPLEEEE